MFQPTWMLKTRVPGIFRIPSRPGVSPSSLGPWGYLVLQQSLRTAVLIDVPGFSSDLVQEMRSVAPGGVTHLFLSHDDFIGMSNHSAWKKEFPEMIRVAHSADCSPSSVELTLQGEGPWEEMDIRIDHMPGHSEGSLFFTSREESAVFTGDSLALWSREPEGFGAHCRFGRKQQAKSLRSYARVTPFCCALLPGHGMPAFFESSEERLAFFMAAAKGLDGFEDEM
mmetsp:Transcript_10339/g.23310  ORF Transcript_10339/g.23310 Transcript_10339/m.23310 type:complete len:225 (-) Transcript_10339:23-697(-)